MCSQEEKNIWLSSSKLFQYYLRNLGQKEEQKVIHTGLFQKNIRAIRTTKYRALGETGAHAKELGRTPYELLSENEALHSLFVLYFYYKFQFLV